MLAHPVKLWRVNTDLRPGNSHGTKMSPQDRAVPSRRRNTTSSIPQTRVALATMASRTGCTSVGERLMILSTSDVAVWCSRASRNSALRSLEFLKQPHVFNGDHLGLRSLEEGNLLISERARLPFGESR